MDRVALFLDVADADIAQALAQIPPYIWPSDESELLALFRQMLDALRCRFDSLREPMAIN